jgi:hypothetical protein
MKIMVVFYSLHDCPWIPGERKHFPVLVFFKKHFFLQFFQENFEIQDGREWCVDCLRFMNEIKHYQLILSNRKWAPYMTLSAQI